MKHIDFIKSYYEPRFHARPSLAGEDHEIVGWESGEAQRKRFEVFCQNVPLEGKKLLDVGCGVGSLLAFIENEKICQPGNPPEYTGIDILENMVKEARIRHPKGNFLIGDVFSSVLFKSGSFDIVFSSGLFNLNYGNNYDFLARAFKKLCEIARETVVINLLHTRSQNKEPKYFYYHPDEVREIIEGICDSGHRITVLEEYLPNDFTLIANK
jgi:ubiquinone/menaquinone biosynthesis C-methylase UbiE